MFKFYRSILAGAAIALGLAACPRPASASPPFRSAIAVDTGGVSVVLDCPAGNYVSCRFSGVVDSVSGTNLTPSPIVVPAGQSSIGLRIPCTAPNQRIAIGGQVVGLNASGTASAPTFGGGSSRCPDVAPSSPSFVIRFIPGGG